MEQNTDPQQIVISREYFDKLLRAASMSNVMEPSDVHPNRTLASAVSWHARKYNPHYKEEIERARDERQKAYQRDKNFALDFVRKYRNQVIQLEINGRIRSVRVIGSYKHNRISVVGKFDDVSAIGTFLFNPRTTIFYEIIRSK